MKDYDEKDNDHKKKFTYFYTKQELDDLERQKHNSMANPLPDFSKIKSPTAGFHFRTQSQTLELLNPIAS